MARRPKINCTEPVHLFGQPKRDQDGPMVEICSHFEDQRAYYNLFLARVLAVDVAGARPMAVVCFAAVEWMRGVDVLAAAGPVCGDRGAAAGIRARCREGEAHAA